MTAKKTVVKGEVKSEKIKHANIFEALSALQGELKPLAKTEQVSFEKKAGGKVEYKFTPLSAITEFLYPLMAKHGLSFRHENVKEETSWGVVAIVTHETYEKRQTLNPITGETRYEVFNEISSGIVKISQAAEMKDIGAAITYARRYSLTQLLGLSTEEDKDAEFLEESAKNATTFAFTRAKDGLDSAKDEKTINKQSEALKKELALVESGKAGVLGLSKDQYESLIEHAAFRLKQLAEVEKAKDKEI